MPLIIFKTHSEFEQQNIAPGAAQEGVLAFAEGERNRMVLPIDLPSDLLYGLIVHELTHVFQYDFIPMSLLRRNIPLWVHEGGAEYERGIWDPLDLMTVRDAAVADIIPRMSQMEGYGDFGSPRLVYNLGHALYEFIEARWGKDGVRQFLFALRKSAIGGGVEPVRRSVPDARARVRPAVREISERPLQGVPRQGAAGRLRPGPLTRSRTHELHGARFRSSRRPRAISSP